MNQYLKGYIIAHRATPNLEAMKLHHGSFGRSISEAWSRFIGPCDTLEISRKREIWNNRGYGPRKCEMRVIP